MKNSRTGRYSGRGSLQRMSRCLTKAVGCCSLLRTRFVMQGDLLASEPKQIETEQGTGRNDLNSVRERFTYLDSATASTPGQKASQRLRCRKATRQLNHGHCERQRSRRLRAPARQSPSITGRRTRSLEIASVAFAPSQCPHTSTYSRTGQVRRCAFSPSSRALSEAGGARHRRSCSPGFDGPA